MPKMFLIDVEGSKKQLLDESAALKVIDNNFERIKQITTLQESEMKYRVTLQGNKKFLVESTKLNKFIDKYFPLLEAFEEDDYEEWDGVEFYPEVCREDTGETIWPNENTSETESRPWSEFSKYMIGWISRKAERLSKKLGVDCFARITDSNDVIAYTESEDESIDDQYLDPSEVEQFNNIKDEPVEETQPDSVGERLRKDLSNEMSIIYQLFDEYKKIGDTTDEAGNSMAETTVKPAIDGKINEWRQHVEDILDCEQQTKSGKVKPGRFDVNIKNHVSAIRELKQWANEVKNRLKERTQKKKDEVATKARRHEDLAQKQGLLWRKEDRMANATPTNTSSFAALRDRLAKNKEAKAQ